MSSDQSQQAPSGGGKTGRRVSKVSVIVWVAVLLVVGVVLFVCFTERGQVMMGNIENQGLWNWLFGEGDEKAESEAIVELEKCGVRVIKETGKGVTSIDFSNCLKPSDETMKQIAKLCQLSTAIFLNAEINDDQLGYLKNLRHLNNLLINGTPITDAGLAQLATLPALQTLHAYNTKISDKGMEALAKIPTLTILNISGTDVSDQGIKQISHLPNLNWLLIQDTKVTDAGLAELSSLPELKRVSFSKDMKISEAGVQNLKKKFPRIQVDINKPAARVEKPSVDANAKPAEESEK